MSLIRNRVRRYFACFGLLAVSAVLAGCEDAPKGQSTTNPIKDHPGKYVELTDANFEDVVLKADGLVMVDFWNVTCQPCLDMAPWVAEISNEYDGRVVVGKLNTLEHVETTSAYRGGTVPAVLFFKDGQVLTFNNLEGMQVDRIAPASKKDMTEVLDMLLAREFGEANEDANPRTSDSSNGRP